MRFLGFLLATASSAVLASPALAQDSTTAASSVSPPMAAPASQQSPEEEGLAEIIVTAQFRQENLQKAAIPVDVIGGGILNNAGVITPSQLTTVVPALQISQANGGTPSIYIRGVGTIVQNAYSDPGVAFNVDGVYIGRPTSIRNTFFDVERVEVLKGPQGTLYGRNATGGAVNVLPRKPRLGSFSGSVGASYGNYDDARIDAAINIPLGDIVAARISGTYSRHDGYLSDGTNDADGGAIRAQLLIQPSDAFNIRIVGDYAHDAGKGPGSVLSGYINPLTGERVSDPLSRRIGVTDPRTTAILRSQYSFQAGRFFDQIPGPLYKDDDFYGIRGELNADLNFAKLTVLSAWRRSRLSSNDVGLGFPYRTDQRDHQSSAEARLASPEEGLIRWLVGGYYFDEGIHLKAIANLSAIGSFQNLRIGTKTSAAFGRLTIAPLDTLRFVGGIRFTHERKRLAGLTNGFSVICTQPAFPLPACPASPLLPFGRNLPEVLNTLGAVQVAPNVYVQPSAPGTILRVSERPVDGTLATSQTTFRAAVEYDVGPQSLLYASFETGFHAGGLGFSASQPSFRPETIQAYTIGSKNRFFGGKVQLNLEGFYWRYKDQQITHFATDNIGLFLLTENAGRSTNKGFEASVEWRALRNTTLRTDLQYLDAKYNDFVYVSPTVPVPLTTACPTTAINATTARVDCSGFRALRSPKWTINAGVTQNVPLGENNIAIALDTHYQTRMVTGYEMLPGLSEQKGYFSTNASVDFNTAAGWSIGAFVNNIEDNQPIGQTSFNSTTNQFTGSPLPPRTYGVRGRFNF